MKKWFDWMLELLYPRKCPVCGRIIEPKGALICPPCRRRVNLVSGPTCFGCGKELFSEDAEYCDSCARHPHRFASGVVLMNYDSVARKILSDLKYHNKRDNADYLAAEAAVQLREEIEGMHADMMIPVPVHSRRRRVRGFNQAELIAKRLGERLDLPVRTDLLKRVKNTLPQKELGSAARLNNLLKAFAVCHADELVEKTVILVDDIYTTGSTAEACTRVLLESGAKKVYLVNMAAGKAR